MEKKVLRVGVIGVGVMGQNHLRVYDLLKTVEIRVIVDVDIKRAQLMADRYHCKAYTHIQQIDLSELDAVSVCVPSVYHAEVAYYFLSQGIHCLLEKPMATNEADCEKLISTAKKTGACLMVGHIERFNPGVQQLNKVLPKGLGIHAIHAERMSSTSARITDVDVIQDLMIHDLDIVLSLFQEFPAKIYAQGVRTDQANGEDYVSALLSFESGAIANVTASRITQNKIRRLNVTTDLGFITLDYMTQELLIHRQGHISRIGNQSAEYGNYALDLSIERVFVRSAESLFLELQHFVDCVLNEKTPLVTGEDALATLRVVWEIQKQAMQLVD